MKSFTEYFMETYYDKLQTPAGNNPQRARGDSLKLVFEILEAKLKGLQRFNMWLDILETGCMRPDHGELNFAGDGCATLIFDDFIERMRGRLTSIDINQKNVDYARSKVKCERTTIICGDSVKELHSIANMLEAPAFDLVYLDSYDIEQANPHPSQLHHLKELAAIMPCLPTGCLVVVDDHDAFFTGGQIGKGNYVKSFMQDIGAKILFEGYQIVFEMP